MKSWQDCKNVLIIRPDNMGDVIMSSPAIRAVKQTFNANISLLTSSMGEKIAPFLPEIDNVITLNLPFVKTDNAKISSLADAAQVLKKYEFEAAIIFTVYSQSAIPAAMLAYEAGIPLRLAYCRENPYDLLTNWVPDEEPYNYILHQVERDLKLVESIGATVVDNQFKIVYPSFAVEKVFGMLTLRGINLNKPWCICHAGVSEKKRQYPAPFWSQIASLLSKDGMQVLFTGTQNEWEDANKIIGAVSSEKVFNFCGAFSMEEFLALIDYAPAIISVNTGTVHIASALQTPAVVLYALTNPQHKPWKSPSLVHEFSVNENIASKNQVVKHVIKSRFKEYKPFPHPITVHKSFMELYKKSNKLSKPFNFHKVFKKKFSHKTSDLLKGN